MDFNQLKSLSHIPDEELTAKLVALGAQIIQHHDVGDGYGQFYWSDIEILPDGSLSIEGVKLVPLTDDVRWENYLDYAGAIYCICTQEKFAESMAADAPRKSSSRCFAKLS